MLLLFLLFTCMFFMPLMEIKIEDLKDFVFFAERRDFLLLFMMFLYLLVLKRINPTFNQSCFIFFHHLHAFEF